MALETAYKVGIALSATNTVSGVLAEISRSLFGIHGQVDELATKFRNLNPAITGAVAAFTGLELGRVVGHIVKAGAELEHFKAQLQAATGDIGKVADATNTAWQETSRNLNSSVSENVKNIQHLMNITGSFDEARRMLHPFTMVDTALASVKDVGLRGGLSGGDGLENNTYNFARALEQLGVTQNEEKLRSYSESMTRAMIAERGKVDGSSYYNAVQNASSARLGWDQDFVTYGLGPLIQATNGRIGSQLYQLDRTYGQGVTTQMLAQGAEKYGLWSSDQEVWQGSHFKGMKPNSGFENEVRRANPVQWAGDVRQLLKQHGVNIDDPDVMNNVIAEIARGNKNLGQAMSELIMPQTYSALLKERKNIEAVPADAVQTLQQKDPTLALQAFNTQWGNLMQALGSPMVETATSILKGLAEGLNAMATTAAAHPDAVKAVGVALAGLSAGLVAVGTVLVGGAALGAAGAVGVTGGVLGLIAGLTTVLTAGAVAIAAYKDAITGFIERVGKALGIAGGNHPPSQMGDDHEERLWKRMAFGGANDNDNPLVQAIRQGFVLAFQDIQGGNFSANGASGGGLINAAYTTYGSGGGGLFGGGRGGNFSGSIGDGSAVSRALGMVGAREGQAAQALHHVMSAGEWCADFVNGIIQQSGGKGSGSAMARSFMGWGHAVGLGSVMKGDVAVLNGGGHVGFFTGEHLPDGRLGIVAGNTRDGHGGHDVEHYFVNPGSVYGARRGNMPNVGAPPQSKAPIVIHNHTVLDKQIVASSTTRVQAHRGRFPTSVGALDAHGSFASPGTPFIDAA